MEEQQEKGSLELKTKISDLPDKPGVYLFKNKKKKIIYIGKARNLKNRVRSYFSGEKDIKTTILVGFIADLEVIITRNEYEALLLENTLIKQWKPRFNINLKDGKSYPVIRITNEEYPRVFRTRRLFLDGSHYYGPFPNAHHIDLYLDIIEQYFPLRKCKGKLKKKKHPCLYYHIKRCIAPCCGHCTKEEYNESVKHIKKLLSGNIADLAKELKGKMIKAAEHLDFESAATYRDQIQAIEHVKEVQSIVDIKKVAGDYIGYAVKEELCSIVIFKSRQGIITGRENFSVEYYTSEEDALLQFILQYYSSIHFLPDIVYLPVERDIDAITSFLRDTGKKNIQVKFPVKGKHLTIIKMAEENAREEIENRTRKLRLKKAVEDLRSGLALPHLPNLIEGFDISHVEGTFTVASMVSFSHGISDKSSYRYFKIRGLKPGQVDDYEAIREVIARRYTRVINDNLRKPDLILIDGGKGQVSAAHSILKKLGIGHIPLIGLAKKNEEVFFPDKQDPVILKETSPALLLLQAVRDESHRFANSLNKKLRKNSISHSILEHIKGIGQKRSITLLTTYGSIDNIIAADPEEIAKTVKLPIEKVYAIIEEIKQLKKKSDTKNPGTHAD